MRIAIFGGGGYLGSTMTAALARAGHEITVVDMFIYGGGPPASWPEKVRVIDADFRDEAVVAEALADAEAVIHLGGFVGEPACDLDQALTMETNLAAPLLAATVARRCGVSRFVFASTCSVYGISTGWLDENSPAGPISLYGYTKLAVEQRLAELAAEQFRVISLRMGTAYGWSERPRFDSVVNLMTAKLCATGQIPVRGGGQWRPIVHVKDVAAAFGAALVRPIPVSAVVNIGADRHNYTILSLAELVRDAVGTGSLAFEPVPEDGRDYRVRFGRSRQLLDFATKVEAPAGVRDMAYAIRRGLVADPFDIRYNNYLGLGDALRRGRIRPVGTTTLLNLLPPVLPELQRFGPPAAPPEPAEAAGGGGR